MGQKTIATRTIFDLFLPSNSSSNCNLNNANIKNQFGLIFVDGLNLHDIIIKMKKVMSDGFQDPEQSKGCLHDVSDDMDGNIHDSYCSPRFLVLLRFIAFIILTARFVLNLANGDKSLFFLV